MEGGTVSGSIDIRLTQTSNNGNQELFTAMYQFLNGPMRSGSYCELHALHTGSTSPTALGTDFYDEATPFGNNAFAVFKFPSGTISGSVSKRSSDMYALIQWSDTAAFGSAPGDPGLLINSMADGVGLAIALRDDGGDPWTGDSNADGNDRKGTPVWTAGPSTLRVFPRSNNTGGTHSTNKQNLARVNDQITSPTRYHFFGNRDGFTVLVDTSDNGSYDSMITVGTYTPIPGLSGTIPNPIFMIGDSSLPLNTTTTYGTTAGSVSTAGGGIIPAMSSSGVEVRGFRFDRYENIQTTTNQPNPQYQSSAYDEFKIPLYVFETDTGLVGYIDFFTEVYNAGNHDVYSDGSKILFLTSTAAGNNFIALPWISGSNVIPDVSSRLGRTI